MKLLLLLKVFAYLSNNWNVNDWVENIPPNHPNNKWPNTWYMDGHNNLHKDFYRELLKRNIE